MVRNLPGQRSLFRLFAFSLHPPLRKLIPGGVLIVVILYSVWMAFSILYDPDIVFLLPKKGASWIRAAEPFAQFCRTPGLDVRHFRTTFTVQEVPPQAVLQLRALKTATVFLDAHPVYETDDYSGNWKSLHRVDLAPFLSPGRHELLILATSTTTPVAIWACSDALAIHTNETWETSQDRQIWHPARLATAKRRAELAEDFPQAPQALLAWLPVLLPVFLLIAGWLMRAEQHTVFAGVKISPGRVRWAMVALWGVLGINNLPKLPAYLGFDSKDHREYILYLVNNWRIPFATEGWEMCNPPLYYLLCAPVAVIAFRFFEVATAVKVLRVPSLLFGMGLIEVSFRSVRCVFPGRSDLQVVGVLLAGLLPMNLYISHYPGNEPLTGLLSGTILLLSLQRICRPAEATPTGSLWLLGLCLGLALLTKVTAILLIVPVALALWYEPGAETMTNASFVRHIIRKYATLFGTAILVAGWWYLRNWVALGRPFVPNWDPIAGQLWWQDPGYRDMGQLWRFGEALVRPVFAGVVGFWDGVYATLWSDSYLGGQGESSTSPPWNYGPMAAGVVLALLPTAAFLVGVVASLREKDMLRQRGLLFCVLCVFIYGIALLHLFLVVPVYGQAKAFYILGAMPCFVLLTLKGLDLTTRTRIARAVVYALLTCWGITVCLAYFVT